MRGDFHLHTTASDGKLTPSELVELAARNGLDIIAITDHDTTEGIAEGRAAGERLGLRVIAGVELSTDIPGGEVHLLALFVDPNHSELQRYLAEMREARLDRGRRMVEKLHALGMPLSWERVTAIASGGAVGRPHIAEAMVERGYVRSVQEAFDLYLGRNGPAYAERPKLTPQDAVRFTVRVGALPVMAHPLDSGLADLEGFLRELKEAGLVGLECYYGPYTSENVAGLVALADRLGLVPTGGGDFHGFDREVGVHPGAFPYPSEAVERLLATATARGLTSALR